MIADNPKKRAKIKSIKNVEKPPIIEKIIVSAFDNRNSKLFTNLD